MQKKKEKKKRRALGASLHRISCQQMTWDSHPNKKQLMRLGASLSYAGLIYQFQSSNETIP